MQPIQHTVCPDRHPSSAAYLAAMIDRRARDHGLSAGRPGEISQGLGTRVQRPDASVLIWVEVNGEPLGEPAAGRHRGMIVVAHGSPQGAAEGSFIISYPVDTGDDGQHVSAVSGVLEAMGWSVLASQRGKTAGEHVNTAALVSTAHPGAGQRLWLAEPLGAAQDPSAPAHALASGSSAAPGRSSEANAPAAGSGDATPDATAQVRATGNPEGPRSPRRRLSWSTS